MGVPDMYRFIETHPDLLVPYKLRNMSVIINGNGLIHRLFYYHKDNFKFGVNYKEFEKVCVDFLQDLQQCKVKAYILFDGALQDEKFSSVIQHNQRRMKAYSKVIRAKRKEYLLNGFAYTVFVKVAKTFHVPFCCCDFEADREVALLANALNCPVLGDDMDFSIFDIKAGFIPWETIKWNHRNRTVVTAKESVPCKIFDKRRFCENLNIGKSLLPLMACLLGNDFISKKDTTPFYRHIQMTKSSQTERKTCAGKGKSNARSKAEKNVLDVTEWLSKYHSHDTALHDLMQILFENNQEDVGRKIESCVQMYLLDHSESKFKHYLEEIESCSNYKEVIPAELGVPTSLPDWFVVLFRLGELQPKFINVIFQKIYCTHLFVEDNRQSSCNKSSQLIRQAIFGILLKNRAVSIRTEDNTGASEDAGHVSEKDSSRSGVNDVKLYESKQTDFVTEYDRLDGGETIKSTDTTPLEQLDSYGPLPHLWCIPKLSGTNRRSLLIEVLGLDLASVTALQLDYQLPTAVTVHCMKNSDPLVSTEQLLAILLCFVRGHMCDSFQSEKASSELAEAGVAEFQSDQIDFHTYNKTAEAAARSESDASQTSSLGTNQEMNIDSKMSSSCATTNLLQGGSSCAGKPHLNSDQSVKFERISDRHLSLVQTCAQWQSCMLYAAYLNTILQDPFPKPDITKLYHGTEISTTYYALIKLDLIKQIEWIRRYFQMVLKSKDAAEMFDQMYEVVKVYCKEVEPQLPVLGRFSKILPEDYVEGAANVFKQKGYSVPKYGHIDEKDERVICFNCGELNHKSPACSRPKSQCSLCEKWGHDSKFCSTIKKFNRHSDFNSIPLSQTQPTEKIMPEAVGPDAPIEMVYSGYAGIDPTLVQDFSGLSLERRIRCFNCGDFDHKSPVCHRPKNKCSICDKWGHDSKFCYTK